MCVCLWGCGWVGVAALASRSVDLRTKVRVTVLIKDCQFVFICFCFDRTYFC